MRCLRLDHGSQRNLLPLPELRQQHGLQLTDARKSARGARWEAASTELLAPSARTPARTPTAQRRRNWLLTL
jgi:hypothetical protein